LQTVITIHNITILLLFSLLFIYLFFLNVALASKTEETSFKKSTKKILPTPNLNGSVLKK